MSCGDGHFGFLIGTKNENIVGQPMNIHVYIGFNQVSKNDIKFPIGLCEIK